MKTYIKQELEEILLSHKKWLIGEAGGVQADLTSADLSSANLTSADLSYADLTSANLSYANLTSADLTSADLSYADLSSAKNLTEIVESSLVLSQLSIVPFEGPFTAWKKCKNGIMVKLLIPEGARRSNSTTRKCRAEFVQVLDIVGATEAVSIHDGVTAYRIGENVRCDHWEENRFIECGGGIHFFITKIEAENYN